MREKEAYLAKRIKDLPVPYVDCEVRQCVRCKEEVWVDKRMRVHWTRMPIICMVCLEKENSGPHTFAIPREIISSLKKFADKQKKLMKR